MFRKSLQFVNATFEQNLVKQRGYKIKKKTTKGCRIYTSVISEEERSGHTSEMKKDLVGLVCRNC